MNKSKLTKETLERFTISYNKAKSLGITDEDLKYISEIGSDKFRISIRTEARRITEVVYGILNAINRKWEIINNLQPKQEELPASIPKEENNQYADLTLKEGFKLFFDYRKTLVEKELLEQSTYELDVTNYNGRLLRDSAILSMKIINITDDIAQKYVDTLYKATPVIATKEDKLSVNTISHLYALLHKVFAYFKDKLRIINYNPFDNVERKPKYKPKINKNYLTISDIKYVLEQIEKKNIRFRTFINLYLETGMRIEEILGLKYSDINRVRNTLKLSRAVIKSRLTGQIVVKDLKTEASEREISISTFTLELIDNYKLFKTYTGQYVSNDDFIFTSWEDNELIVPSKYTEEWKKFIEALGYTDLPLENIRHSAATFMLQGNNVNIEATKRRFGWSKRSTVFNIYNQASLDDDKRLLNKFEETFRNSLGCSMSELYRICVGRYNNRRKLKNILQKLLNKPLDEIDLETDLKQCQEYLFELYPLFKKIAVIDTELDDEEIENIFVGFKDIYNNVKIEPL